MGWFDGVPVLEDVEDTAGDIAGGAANVANQGLSAADDAAEFADHFAEDPIGAVTGAIGDVSWDTVTSAVGTGVLDVGVVRDDRLTVTAAWQPGDTNWRGWWRLR